MFYACLTRVYACFNAFKEMFHICPLLPSAYVVKVITVYVSRICLPVRDITFQRIVAETLFLFLYVGTYLLCLGQVPIPRLSRQFQGHGNEKMFYSGI